ncbi:hypothetical protein SCLCIDRAFT_1206542 [Scleroderma citrinum Foug A]|uniref:Endonuclease/exonuclease/phosphatase domain-containing protein n=1 Tax=Scleroderma citrinum Foug A TaxID=1036808 RepID=A0A0C3ECH2_9AGAM|nr:hypothetical protein SCLCIDRAFT_1206542 [Scleroderma citrinum Foug A]
MDLEPQPPSSTFSPTPLRRGETLPSTQNHCGLHPDPPAPGSSSLALARRGRASSPAGGPPEDTPRPIGSETEQHGYAPHPTPPRTEPIEPIEPIEPNEPIEPIEPALPSINGYHRTQRLPPGAQNEPLPNKKYRANLIIASLDMRGRSSQSMGSGPIPKWTSVLNMLRTKQIGVLALQETHLNDETTSQIRTVFDKRMMILNSGVPVNPTASAGVAFVLNKEKLDIKDATLKVLIPGRATFLSLEWQREEPLHLINIYAPTDLRVHPEFWKKTRRTMASSHH